MSDLGFRVNRVGFTMSAMSPVYPRLGNVSLHCNEMSKRA